MKIVISQSMLFPWIGMLEQVRLADVFVHYDDVQFSKGGFTNRVQMKTANGMKWMTVPLQNLHLGQCIDKVEVAPVSAWKPQLLNLLELSLGGAPYYDDAAYLAKNVFSAAYVSIGDLARASLMVLVEYFGLDRNTNFVDARDLGIAGTSSARVLSIVRHLNASTYVTGHGASRYLDHCMFEAAGIQIEYMKYSCIPYPQLHGDFTPYVSALDLIANCGKDGVNYIRPETCSWKEFISERA